MKHLFMIYLDKRMQAYTYACMISALPFSLNAVNDSTGVTLPDALSPLCLFCACLSGFCVQICEKQLFAT